MLYQTATRWLRSHHRKKQADASGHRHAIAYWDIGKAEGELRTTLYEGEYAVIDSSTRYAKDRKIVKVRNDGTEENLFNSKNNASSIWEKIPAGLSIVSWNGAFGFDIILFNERGTPRWTSR